MLGIATRKVPELHVVGDRMVFTYQPAGWPTGCLTGYLNRAGAFVLEHVVAFPGAPAGTLMAMLKACLAEAWEREYPHVRIYIPADHPQHQGLTALATRCGFSEYATGWWVLHRRPR